MVKEISAGRAKPTKLKLEVSAEVKGSFKCVKGIPSQDLWDTVSSRSLAPPPLPNAFPLPPRLLIAVTSVG